MPNITESAFEDAIVDILVSGYPDTVPATHTAEPTLDREEFVPGGVPSLDVAKEKLSCA